MSEEALNQQPSETEEGIEEFHGMSTEAWYKMSWWAIIFIVIKIFRAIFVQNWPSLIALFAFLKSQDFSLPIIIGGGVATLVIIGFFSLLAFLRTRFFWDDEFFYMKSGIFNRKLRRIPFERVQSVNTSQNIIHRFLNLVSMDIDSAGSAGQEVQLSAVSKKVSDAFSERVYAFKEQMTENELNVLEVDAQATAQSQEDERIAKVKSSDIVLFALFENHLKTIGLILAFLLTIFQQVNDAFEDLPKEYIEEQSQLLFKNFESDLALFLILIGTLSVGVTILFTIIRLLLTHFGTELYKTSKGYRKISGLLTRKKTELGLSKVQMIKWSTNPLKAMFGLYGFTLSNASPKVADPNNLFGSTFYIPALRWHAIEHTVGRILNRKAPDLQIAPNPVSFRYVFRQTRYIGFLPSLVSSSILIYFEFYLWIILPAIWWISVFVSLFLYRRNFRMLFDEETAWIKYGIIGRRWKAIEWFKIHNVTLKSSPHQRKKALRTIVLHTSGDTLKIPYVDLESAKKIRDIALWQINTKERPWM